LAWDAAVTASQAVVRVYEGPRSQDRLLHPLPSGQNWEWARRRSDRIPFWKNGFEMNYLKVIGFVIGFLLILTFLFYVIGIYNIE
jgi:hypothetical protein